MGVAVRVWSLTADQADGVAGKGKIGAFGNSLSRRLLTGEGHKCLPATLTTPVIQHEHRVRLELKELPLQTQPFFRLNQTPALITHSNQAAVVFRNILQHNEPQSVLKALLYTQTLITFLNSVHIFRENGTAVLVGV